MRPAVEALEVGPEEEEPERERAAASLEHGVPAGVVVAAVAV